MLSFKVKGVKLHQVEAEDLTSGMVGTQIKFLFYDSWILMGKTAVFEWKSSENASNSVVLDQLIGSGDTVIETIPHEVMDSVGVMRVGVYGTDGTQSTPTIFSNWLKVEHGAVPSGITSTPSENLVEQILYNSSSAVNTANSAKEIAENAVISVNADKVAAEEASADAISAKEYVEQAVSDLESYVEDKEASSSQSASDALSYKESAESAKADAERARDCAILAKNTTLAKAEEVAENSETVCGVASSIEAKVNNANTYMQRAESAAASAHNDYLASYESATDAEHSASDAHDSAESAATSANIAGSYVGTIQSASNAVIAAQDTVRGYLDTVVSKAQEASASATQAESCVSGASSALVSVLVAKDAAESAKIAAESAKTASEASSASSQLAKDRAESAMVDAEEARDEAETARAGAESAKTDAETAKNKAEAAVGKTPYIGTGSRWFEWDSESNSFVDSGVFATGSNAPNVLYQYSLDNDSWHDTYVTSDVYDRVSCDNGNTWSTGRRIRGENGRNGSDASVTADNVNAAFSSATDVQKQTARDNIGAAAVPSDYELVEEITLAEDTSAINRTEEPDGTPYNFTSFFFTAECPQVAAAGSIYLVLDTTSVLYCSGALSTNDAGGYAIGTADIVGGRLAASGRGGINKGYTTALAYVYVKTYMEELAAITTVSIRGTVPIPAGAMIKIYGVRA